MTIGYTSRPWLDKTPSSKLGSFPINLFIGKTGVSVYRTGTEYQIQQEFNDSEAVSYNLKSATIGAVTFHSIDNINTTAILDVIDETEGTPTGTWITDAGAYWGGFRKRTTTPGSYFTFTLPAYATDLYFRMININGGLVKISINGDYTLATGVLTAQELVDAGYAEAAVLVANGGTLNPTDRILDNKTNTTPTFYQIASGSLGNAVVVFEYTGYKNPTSTGTTLFVDAIAVGCPMVNANFHQSYGKDTLTAAGSVVECASILLPTGAGTPTWVGNGHGYENQTALVFYVDGSLVAPSDGSYTVGVDEVKAIRTSQYFHPDLGATVVADVVTTYSIKSKTGLDITTQITWALGGRVDTTPSPMLPLAQTIFDKGTTQLSGVNYDLTGDDGSLYGSDLSRIIWLWDADGTLGAVLSVPAGQSKLSYMEDRVGGTLNKIYFSYCNTSTNVIAGNVWIIKGNYRFQRFVSADTILAK